MLLSHVSDATWFAITNANLPKSTKEIVFRTHLGIPVPARVDSGSLPENGNSLICLKSPL